MHNLNLGEKWGDKKNSTMIKMCLNQTLNAIFPCKVSSLICANLDPNIRLLEL